MSGALNLVRRLNHGVDLGGNPSVRPTSFAIGVGVNPTAANLTDDLENRGPRISIVAGIWPLVSVRNAEFLSNDISKSTLRPPSCSAGAPPAKAARSMR